MCKAWLAEFYRLKDKCFVDQTLYDECKKQLQPWSDSDYKPLSIVQEMFKDQDIQFKEGIQNLKLEN